MARWIFVTVLMSLMQPAMGSLALLMYGYVPSFADLIGRGELFPATSGLSIYAVSSLFTGRASPAERHFLGGPAIFVLLLATFSGTFVQGMARSGNPFDQVMVAWLSLAMYAIAVGIGTRCAMLSEKK